MTIKQLSIFIENQSGTLINVLDVLKQAGIQIVASTIADTAEYGIYRMICNEPNRAYEALRTAGIAVALSDVFAIALDNTPGRAADAIRAFSDAHISIAYLYSFLLKDNGILVFRIDEMEAACKVIRDNNLRYINEENIVQWL